MYYADDRLDSLADRLAPLVADRGFGSFLDYFYLLKYDPLADDEWDRVMDTLSVGETYFWREMDQMHAVVSDILPGARRGSANRADPLLERALRVRRGAADAGDVARLGGLVRPRADRDLRR